jgi:hypothetical protein
MTRAPQLTDRQIRALLSAVLFALDGPDDNPTDPDVTAQRSAAQTLRDLLAWRQTRKKGPHEQS